MANKISLDEILSKENTKWAHDAVRNGVLTKRSRFSESKLVLINALIERDPELTQKPKYIEVREVAKEAGITETISQSSIKSVLDILYFDEGTLLGNKVVRVDLIEYAVKSRLLPIALNEKNAPEEKQLLRWRQTVRNVVAPIILTSMFVNKAMASGGKAAKVYKEIPRLLKQMDDLTTPNADGVLVSLENADFGVHSRSLQKISKSKQGRMLSYKAITDIHEASAYLYRDFVIDIGERMHSSYDSIADHSIGALEVVEKLLEIESYDEECAGKMVLSYINSLILNDTEMVRGLSMFD